MNPIYGELSNNNMASQFNIFKQNPIQFLASHRVNIPEQYKNDPKGAVQYLMNNGQMNQQQFNQLSQLVNQMGIRL